MNLSYVLLCLYSHIDAMACFHHPGDPYFPIQGNEGWTVEDPKEDPEEILEEEEDESHVEFEVIDPPYIARVPAHRWGYNGPTPRGCMTLRDGAGIRGNTHLMGWSEDFMTFVMEDPLTEPFPSWSGGFRTLEIRRR